MKRYIRQILLGTLLLGSACTNHQEVIEGDTSVSVVFKTRQLPSTKGENDDEISVLIFRKEKDQFTKVESIQESPWLFEQEQLQKNILLPTGIYRFLLAKGFSNSPGNSGKISFVTDNNPGNLVSTSYDRNYYFQYPTRTLNGQTELNHCTTALFTDKNEESTQNSQTEYDLSQTNRTLISRKISHLQGQLCFIIQRAKKENGQYTLIDSPENSFDNALKKISAINLTIEGSSQCCYLSETGLIFKSPMSYHCLVQLQNGDYSFKRFDADQFVSLFSPIIEKTDYQRYEGAAYCEGPLLFPAPLDQTIRVTIDIDYTGTLKNKTFTLENIPLERNKMYLFTLWLLNEDVDISISPDADLDLEELKFNNQITGNDGFWN